MITIYGDIYSGNCYKIGLLALLLDLPHHWQKIDILHGESRTREFLEQNPNGKVPCIKLESGEFLWESNAILNYLADGTPWLPNDRLLGAKILQWQFFEQYSHEPFIATARYINKYLGLPDDKKAEYESKQAGGHKALAVMEQHLAKHPFFVGDSPTIADISLFAYTHVAEEGGFALERYQAVEGWIGRIKSLQGFRTMEEIDSTSHRSN